MCVIAFAPSPAALPSREQLSRACESNPDGFGWAVIVGSEIVTHRSMSAVEAIDSYLDTVVGATGPSLFHARIASHGTVDIDNCHPFLVGGDSDVVLAHNGILDIVPGPFDGRSDTAIFADYVLPYAGIETLDSNPDAWEQWIGVRNKIVILSTSPRLAHSAYLLNEASGGWDDGVWWSNQSYLPYRPLPSYRSYSPVLPDPDIPDEPDDYEDGEDDAWCASCRELVPGLECIELDGENICIACAQAIYGPDSTDEPYVSLSPARRSLR